MKKVNQIATSIGILAAIGLAAMSPATAVAAETYDVVILNGRVMDPESRLDDVRNIGISNGRIALITTQEIQGAQTIDATNHVVAPGFIDVHSHGQDPFAFKLKLRDGVTTALEIEAGAYPVGDYYQTFTGKAQLNYGASVSHIFARIAVMDGVDPKGQGMYSGAVNAAAAHGSNWNKCALILRRSWKK